MSGTNYSDVDGIDSLPPASDGVFFEGAEEFRLHNSNSCRRSHQEKVCPCSLAQTCLDDALPPR